MRALPNLSAALLLTCAAALPACSGEEEADTARIPLDDPSPGAEGAEEASAQTPADAGSDADSETVSENEAQDVVIAAEEATPMADRVATIGLLNKRNNVSTDLEMRPGETVEEGPVIITLAACERTAPWELPQETGAFVQVDVLERGQSNHARVFSGWLFKRSPSLNVVEHPIYDVWVKDCAMRFPGDAPAAG